MKLSRLVRNTVKTTTSKQISALKGDTYAFVDVETTGTSATYGQIIEIGIIRVEKGKITDTYQTLIRPSRSLNPYITEITGITDADLENQPTFDEVALRIHELLDSAIFIAHNARFDYSFLKHEFKRLGMNWRAKTLCTVKLSRMLYPKEKSHALASIIARHNIVVKNRHRAFDDAEVMLKFLLIAEAEHGTETIEATINKVLGSYVLPTDLDPKIVMNLPHLPGVYFFYDADDTLLYIGKSVDIKTRVKSHFSQDYMSGKERALTEQVAYIDYEVTSGELSALLRESLLIKELAPPYNRQLRGSKELVILATAFDKYGYSIAEPQHIDPSSLGGTDHILGVFRSITQAKGFAQKIVKEHMLCPKMIGSEKGKGACFSYQLGTCKGACVRKEHPEEYNVRFLNAFKKSRIRSWPFPGAITVPEDPEAIEGTAYVVHHWKILSKVSYTSEGHTSQEIDQPFDFDTYRILSKHLLKKV